MKEPTGQEDTKTTPKEQEKTVQEPAPVTDTVQINDLPVRKYNTDTVSSFLTTVFGQEKLPDGENILTWRVAVGSKPQYPLSEEKLLTTLERTNTPAALYVGTATCHADESGRLYNRKGLFGRLYFLVLDDIGTKIPMDRIPKAFTPSFIIESSAGNFQYGYVLDEPISDYEAASMLVQLVYESGVSDEGGKMANKLVRLPEGVNGKAGVKRDFVTKLVELNDTVWTPAEILEQIGSDVVWADVLEDAAEVAKRRAGSKAGASLWSPVKTHAVALNGSIDPVLEFLYEQDQVIQDIGEWVTIECPNAHDHTNGDPAAGYMPIGRGAKPNSRAFNCFHETCKNFSTIDFLQHIAVNDGPEAGITDHAAELVATWVYDVDADAVWKVRDTTEPFMVTMQAFKNLYPHSVTINTADGKYKRVKETAMWHTAPARVNVYGQTFAPYSPSRLVDVNDHLRLNTFAPPAWGEGAAGGEHVDKFLDFVDFLMPDEEDADYFLDWLSAKAQDMGFRGAAILMYAKQQGTGRTTLCDMVGTLFGKHNIENVPFNKIVDEGAFNDWLQTPIIVSDETLNTGDTNYWKIYEKLKELIDPRPKRMRLNPKYGKQRLGTVYSSFIFLSNHENAIAMAGGDRRFYVMENALQPQRPEYYTALNDWLQEKDANGEPAWAGDVWRWLQKREFDMEMLLAPPKRTAAKDHMLDDSESGMEVVVRTMLEYWPSPYMSGFFVKEITETFAGRIGLYEMKGWDKVIKKMFKAVTQGYPTNVVVKLADRSTRPRLIIKKMNGPDVVGVREAHVKANRAEIARSMRAAEMDIEKIRDKISEALDLADL